MNLSWIDMTNSRAALPAGLWGTARFLTRCVAAKTDSAMRHSGWPWRRLLLVALACASLAGCVAYPASPAPTYYYQPYYYQPNYIAPYA